MSDYLEQLNEESMPQIVREIFVHWCVWEQARPALINVLDAVDLNALSREIAATSNVNDVLQVGEATNAAIKEMRLRTGPLSLSAAEAATYEFAQMAQAADERNLDPEAVAFFAARVCGWAGWANSGFSDPNQKVTAEEKARDEQNQRLDELLNQYLT